MMKFQMSEEEKKRVRLMNLFSWHAGSICEKRVFSMNKHVFALRTV